MGRGLGGQAADKRNGAILFLVIGLACDCYFGRVLLNLHSSIWGRGDREKGRG